jgi:hypothetical protein
MIPKLVRCRLETLNVNGFLEADQSFLEVNSTPWRFGSTLTSLPRLAVNKGSQGEN